LRKFVEHWPKIANFSGHMTRGLARILGGNWTGCELEKVRLAVGANFLSSQIGLHELENTL
jgi:hypothetical protein